MPHADITHTLYLPQATLARPPFHMHMHIQHACMHTYIHLPQATLAHCLGPPLHMHMDMQHAHACNMHTYTYRRPHLFTAWNHHSTVIHHLGANDPLLNNSARSPHILQHALTHSTLFPRLLPGLPPQLQETLSRDAPTWGDKLRRGRGGVEGRGEAVVTGVSRAEGAPRPAAAAG